MRDIHQVKNIDLDLFVEVFVYFNLYLDDQINEFLRLNKSLFSSKREFLTKLREVRQKLMNTNSLPRDKKQTEFKDV